MSHADNIQETRLPKQPDEKPAHPIGRLPSKDDLEIVWKVAAGVSVACYLIGFIVVNIHFKRFGYYSVSLLSSQYLIAGIWAIVPVELGWVFVLYLLLRSPGELAWPHSDIMKTIVVLLLTVGAVGFLFGLNSAWIKGLSLKLRWIIFCSAGFFLTLPIGAFFWWLSPLRSLTRRWIPLTVVLAFFAGLFAIAYLQAFSRHLYGEISGTLGGGKPRLVRLIVSREAKEDLAAAGIIFSQESRTSRSLKLLIATEKEYIVL